MSDEPIRSEFSGCGPENTMASVAAKMGAVDPSDIHRENTVCSQLLLYQLDSLIRQAARWHRHHRNLFESQQVVLELGQDTPLLLHVEGANFSYALAPIVGGAGSEGQPAASRVPSYGQPVPDEPLTPGGWSDE